MHRVPISRRGFLVRTRGLGLLGAAALSFPWGTNAAAPAITRRSSQRVDVVICGGGLGGCAAAIAVCRLGLRAILTEETDWIGGQLTSQAVPPDEHRWIEQFGCTRAYRALRDGIRDYYRRHYPLNEFSRSQSNLNPGRGSVSRLCHEPEVALAVLESMLARYCSTGLLTILREHRVVGAEVDGDRIRSVMIRDLRQGRDSAWDGRWFVDATELGDLLPLAGVEFVMGSEGRPATGELHAPEKSDPDNQQAFTFCYAIEHRAGEDFTIERPKDYAFWRSYVPHLSPAWPGPLLSWEGTEPRSGKPRTLGFDPTRESAGPALNLWVYRRIAAAASFAPGTYSSDISLINWPQNDYFLGPLTAADESQRKQHLEGAKQLSLSLLYWMQTEAPRPDGGMGWPGLRLRADIVGTTDGLAKAPYVRESRRIRALHTIREHECGRQARAEHLGRPADVVTSERYQDSVGIGHYPIDLHPTCGGDNYIDFDALPFQIPLGALLPVRMENLLPANKNIGTTHVTNGCYRLHPVEWNIGEAVGAVIAFADRKGTVPRGVRENSELLSEFQTLLRDHGVEIRWPDGPW